MNDDQIRQLVAQSVSDALAAKDQEIAGAIADALRTYADRPVGEKGAPSLQYGIVEEVFDTYAAVTLDGQTGSVPINMLGGLVVGERVAVLLVPPSGNLAIGMVTPSTVPPVTPGNATNFPVGPLDDGTNTYEITAAAGLLDATNTLDADPGTQAVISGGSGTSGGNALAATFIEATTAAGSDAKISAAAQASGAQGAEAILAVTNDIGNIGSIQVAVQNGAHVAAIQLNAAVITVGSLPTSDPGNPGQLYTSAGVVMRSP